MLAISDTVWLSIIALLGVVWTGIMTLLLAWVNRVKSDVRVVRDGQVHTDANVLKIEKATNSIVKQLVDTTRAESHAAGLKEGQEARDEKN